MKLIEMQFESEQDRDAAALAIIAIREKQPEPQLREAHKPMLMVWETERAAFENEMKRLGVQYHADHETEVSTAQ